MRLRLPELLKTHGMTPYRFAKAMAATGRVTESTAYRIVQLEGRLTTFDAELFDALCEVFNVGPGSLLEPDDGKKRPAKSPAKPPVKRAAKRS